MMSPTTLVFVLIATFIALRAGSRWRHNSRTWQDHRNLKSGLKTLRKTRWRTFKAALIAVVLIIVYLVVTAAISFASRR